MQGILKTREIRLLRALCTMKTSLQTLQQTPPQDYVDGNKS